MSKAFYLRLAFDNLKKNAKMYVPYLLTSILTTMMYYMVTSLASNPNMQSMLGGDVIQEMLGFGTVVISIFSVIFLFYTNSFLIKRRKKEFGLFNILGMEKKHLSRVIAYESIFSLVISLVLGIGVGILLDKAFYLLIVKMLGAEITLGFYVSSQAIVQSVILFAIIYVLIYAFSLIQIKLSNPIELLHSDQTGEKEPKTKWIMTILGILSLSAGYYIAVTVNNPISALALFFVAVVLVIVGTYFLFTAGSIVVLKLLRKNKTYYYKTNHFISVSNMMYRMKQNAVGLANICILSTMVLVMLSTTISLWTGMNDMLAERYPREITINLHADLNNSIQTLDDSVAALGIETEDTMTYRFLGFSALRNGNTFDSGSDSVNISDINKVGGIYFIPLEDYNRLTNENKTLADNEALVYANRESYDEDTLSIFDYTFNVKEQLTEMVDIGNAEANIQSSYFVIVNSVDIVQDIDQKQAQVYGKNRSFATTFYGFNLVDESLSQQNVCEQLINIIPRNENQLAYADNKEYGYQSMISLYASFLFIGIFLSILFVMATVLIMYYKQITEGYDDKKRFEIMQNVGLDKKEVKKTINSQVLTVFFLPLIMAAIHIAFAFPMIDKLLRLLYLTNTSLYIVTTIVCFGVFAVIYVLIYTLTSKTYYGIVRRSM